MAAIPMANTDFFSSIDDIKSMKKINKKTNDRPLLKDIVEARFIKSSNKLHYKTTHAEWKYKPFDFVKEKIDLKKGFLQNENIPRGINSKKKKGILKLLTIIPHAHHASWLNMKENLSSKDLMSNDC